MNQRVNAGRRVVAQQSLFDTINEKTIVSVANAARDVNPVFPLIQAGVDIITFPALPVF